MVIKLTVLLTYPTHSVFGHSFVTAGRNYAVGPDHGVYPSP